MEFVFLTAAFYEDHPKEKFPEMEHKQDRPYVLILVTIGANRFAIPLRSHIAHPYAYITDKARRCGADYTKAVVITDEARYIDTYRSACKSENARDQMLVRYSTLQYFEDCL